jgi:hypothetical protein
MADKAYSSAANRAYLRKRGIKAVIPVKDDQKKHRRARGRPPAFDAGRYKERKAVERCTSGGWTLTVHPDGTSQVRSPGGKIIRSHSPPPRPG